MVRPTRSSASPAIHAALSWTAATPSRSICRYLKDDFRTTRFSSEPRQTHRSSSMRSAPVIASLDPNLVVTASTLEQMLHQTPPFLISGLAATIASIIGMLGLLLASMGIFGTVSYIVVLRTREMGIRMALGAKKRDILGLMLRESTRPVLAGLARRDDSLHRSLLSDARNTLRSQHRRWHLIRRRLTLVSCHRAVRHLPAVPARHARRSRGSASVRIGSLFCQKLRAPAA